MNWRSVLHRTSLILGLISLLLALWGGTHLQHLLDDAARGFCDLKLFPGAYKGIDVPAASASSARHLFQWLSEVMPPVR